MGVEEHRDRAPKSISFAVITVSDTRTDTDDISGNSIVQLMERAGHKSVRKVIVKDEVAEIQRVLWLGRFPALVYPLGWLGYSIEFVLGGFALPAPYLEIIPVVGSFSYKLSAWAMLGLATVVLPLLWISGKRLAFFLRTQGLEKGEVRLPLVIFLAWTALHNLGYMISLPIIGSASRYACLNHIAIWLALGLGLSRVHRIRYKFWSLAWLTAIALAGLLYWDRVYDANIEHMLKVRIAAADYIREQIPPGETCAAFDVGALRYYSQRPLVDLGGLIDPELFQWLTAGTPDQYLVENGKSPAWPYLGGPV